MMNGLTTKEAEESRAKNGSNQLTVIPPDPLWKKILEGFKDPMILILCAALVIQVILWIMGQAEWFEPVGILIAIMIANGVASISENKQENKAAALRQEEEDKETAKVVRDGSLQQIHINDIVVGDVVYVQAGDKLPADGTVVEGTLKIDQSALNGETEEAVKSVNEKNETFDRKDLLNKFYVYRGTVICGGEGYVKIDTVGDKTLFGELALEVQEDTRETPLQHKLGVLAKQISTFGYIGAIAIIVGVLLKTILTGHTPTDFTGWIRLIIDAVTVAVTVIVCAVPEGLPMLTSILLSFQSMKMAKDNVLVHKINGLETAGSVDILFSDKTGTITAGKLSVVEVATGNVTRFKSLNDMPPQLSLDMITGIGVNNSSVVSNGEIIGGNSTDRALMSFIAAENAHSRINKEEVKAFDAFNSEKKYSSVTITRNGKTAVYIKGAPEVIIARCQSFVNEKGETVPLTERNYLMTYLNEQAGRSMRLLGVAKADSEEQDAPLTLVGVVSIRDDVRTEAKDAIAEVHEAGIQVVMVTGDRKETAVAIAKEAGILTEDDDVALTSQELNALSDDEVVKILPRLKVVSRALPTDKSRLVRIAQSLDHVVGMTGDGVNDSPALKKADVGFAMGSGTEVAKEAGDITILDDNFLSIKKAILYGRTMFKSIRKFLIFQLTVNVAAVLTCFIGPLLGENVMLTVIQLLLINLAMDTLAAIAFGSEPALKEYMKEKPIPRKQGIVTKGMLTQVIISGLYITGVCLAIRFIPAFIDMFGIGDLSTTIAEKQSHAPQTMYLLSAVFAFFMMAITWNGFNARTEHFNVFESLGRNRNFLIVMLTIFVVQFVFVTFGGEFLSVRALNLRTWLICLVLSFMVIPIDMIRKAVTNKKA